MKSKKLFKEVVFASIFLLILGCSNQKTTVFILSSYDDKDICGQPQVEGATEALRTHFSNIKIEKIYLNSQRESEREVEEKCNNFLISVKSQNPSLIITIDDIAFQCAAKHLMGDKIPIVFSGLNITPESYNAKYKFMEKRKPIKNFTGIYEKLFVTKHIEMLEVLLGKIEKIAIIYSTDFMGNALKEQVIYELKDSDFENKLVFYPVSSLQELILATEDINKRKDIIAYYPFVMSIRNGKVFTIADVASIMINKIKKIDLAINQQFVELGFFGGVSTDFYEMGFRAGEMAFHILTTGKLSDLEIEDAKNFVRILNLKRAKDIKIKISDKKLSLFDEIIQ
ncbi:MAG: ABC transporter substrate binding protein [Thermodesulfovibrio sp.]